MNKMNMGRRRIIKGSAAAAIVSLFPGFAGKLAFAQSGRTLTVAIPTNPSTFDPINQSNHDAMVVNQLIFENLVEIDGNGRRVPMLAKALPKVSADRKTYTFDLREDVKFQDGKPFNAEDVKYSYEYILNPENKAFRRAVWTPIESIETEGDYRVHFKLKHPYRPFLDYMTKYMGIFPAKSREKFGKDHFQRTPVNVGTGPAIFVAAKSNDFIELRRNPQYWRKIEGNWDRIVIKIIPEDAARQASLMSGEVHIISAPIARDFKRMSALPNLSGSAKLARGSSLFLAGNNKKAPFDDVNFRKAISLAVDREIICQKLCYGMAEATAMPMAASSWWASKEVNQRLAYNLDKAREALKQSKYANGAEFDLMYSAQAYLVDMADPAIFLQSALGKLGIKVNLRPVETSTLFTQVAGGNHGAALLSVVTPAEPTFLTQALFKPGEAFVRASGYENPALTKLIMDSYAADTEAELTPILYRIQEILAEDCPITFIGTLKNFNLWRSSVKGFEVNEGLTLRLADISLA